MPRQGFVFALKGPAVYQELYEFREDPDELHRRLAYDLQRFWDSNDRLLGPVRRAFRLAAFSLVAEVVASWPAIPSDGMADKPTPPPPPAPTPNIGLPEVRGGGKRRG
jgi:hypothetical protein